MIKVNILGDLPEVMPPITLRVLMKEVLRAEILRLKYVPPSLLHSFKASVSDIHKKYQLRTPMQKIHQSKGKQVKTSEYIQYETKSRQPRGFIKNIHSSFVPS